MLDRSIRVLAIVGVVPVLVIALAATPAAPGSDGPQASDTGATTRPGATTKPGGEQADPASGSKSGESSERRRDRRSGRGRLAGGVGPTGAIAMAHGKRVWVTKPAFEADVRLEFGGGAVFEGSMLYEIGGGRVRFEITGAGGEDLVLVFDGEKAWVSPASSEFPRARFHLLTWPYFLAVPFKLDDPGARFESIGAVEMNDRDYRAGKLTFEAGTGDAPDDWYILYSDPYSNRLQVLAYIVTYGATDEQAVEKARSEPHAITYEDHQRIDGVLIPTRWQFWNWSESRGVHGDRLGQFTLEDARFVEPAATAFDRPADAREDVLPGG